MKRLEVYGGMKRIAIWVGKDQWKSFGKLVGDGSRSDCIRGFIDRVIAKNAVKKGGKKK